MWDSASYSCCDNICLEGGKVHCTADDPDKAQHGTYIREERVSLVVECEWEKLEHETKTKNLEHVQNLQRET